MYGFGLILICNGDFLRPFIWSFFYVTRIFGTGEL